MHVLVPFSISNDGRKAIEKTVRLFSDYADASIEALHITTKDADAVTDSYKHAVHTTVPDDAAADVSVSILTIESDLSGKEIANKVQTQAQVKNTDMIVTGRRNKSLLQALRETSVSKQLLKHSDIPVLVVPETVEK